MRKSAGRSGKGGGGVDLETARDVRSLRGKNDKKLRLPIAPAQSNEDERF